MRRRGRGALPTQKEGASMRLNGIIRPALVVLLAVVACKTVRAEGDLHKAKHIIIVMQENHSFDNYFGALAYAPGSPYRNGNGACVSNDHSCVDGLTCTS